MIREQISTTGLTEVLAQVERALETPVVPGELPQWWDNLAATTNLLEPAMRRQVDGRHEEMLAQMRDQDDEILSRVQRLEEEDCALLEEIRSFQSSLMASCAGPAEEAAVGPAVEPDEQSAAALVTKTQERGLALVIRIRKQEVAMDTWFMEAFRRDRGVVD